MFAVVTLAYTALGWTLLMVVQGKANRRLIASQHSDQRTLAALTLIPRLSVRGSRSLCEPAAGLAAAGSSSP